MSLERKVRGVAARRVAGVLFVAALALSCGPASDPGGGPATSGEALTRSPASTAVPWAAKLGFINGGGCSVYVLSNHWIMGVKHCFDSWVGAGSFPIIYTAPNGVQQVIYNGPGVVRTYPWSSGHVEDIGLVYLVNGLGANLGLTGQAKLYADTRHPWCSYSDPSELVFWIAGYGGGTDVGGSNDCGTSTTTIKRLNTFALRSGSCSGALDLWSTPSEVHPCYGDSGAAMLLVRDGEYLAFAHAAWASCLVGSCSAGGVRIEPFLGWIHDTSAEVDPQHGLVLRYGSTLSGYGYASYVESAPISVAVTPSSATVSPNATVQFSAQVTGSTNAGVTWSVAEGATGGSVTSTGLYTAPQQRGTYHVVATSVADGMRSASATITVAGPSRLFEVCTHGNDGVNQDLSTTSGSVTTYNCTSYPQSKTFVSPPLAAPVTITQPISSSHYAYLDTFIDPGGVRVEHLHNGSPFCTCNALADSYDIQGPITLACSCTPTPTTFQVGERYAVRITTMGANLEEGDSVNSSCDSPYDFVTIAEPLVF
jgi:hypothetical protein